MSETAPTPSVKNPIRTPLHNHSLYAENLSQTPTGFLISVSSHESWPADSVGPVPFGSSDPSSCSSEGLSKLDLMFGCGTNIFLHKEKMNLGEDRYV